LFGEDSILVVLKIFVVIIESHITWVLGV